MYVLAVLDLYCCLQAFSVCSVGPLPALASLVKGTGSSTLRLQLSLAVPPHVGSSQAGD